MSDVSDNSIDDEAFLLLLCSRFPSILGNPENHADTSTASLANKLAIETQGAIDAYETEVVRKHFDFVEGVFQNATPEIRQVIQICYLAELRFDPWKMLPRDRSGQLMPAVQAAFRDLESHFGRLERHGLETEG